jgi:uncharacterized membrane protein
MTGESPASESRIKGALCYFPFIGWIISVFFILTEREDHFVRFNALQSLMLLLLYIAISLFLNMMSSILDQFFYALLIIGMVNRLLFPGYLVLSFYLIYKSYNGELVLLPKLGATAERHK